MASFFFCQILDIQFKVNALEIMRDGIEQEEITGDGMAHGNHRMAHLITKRKSSELFLLHAPNLIIT